MKNKNDKGKVGTWEQWQDLWSRSYFNVRDTATINTTTAPIIAHFLFHHPFTSIKFFIFLLLSTRTLVSAMSNQLRTYSSFPCEYCVCVCVYRQKKKPTKKYKIPLISNLVPILGANIYKIWSFIHEWCVTESNIYYKRLRHLELHWLRKGLGLGQSRGRETTHWFLCQRVLAHWRWGVGIPQSRSGAWEYDGKRVNFIKRVENTNEAGYM